MYLRLRKLVAEPTSSAQSLPRARQCPVRPLNRESQNCCRIPSPEAKQAGLREGDILLAVNGRPLKATAVYGEQVPQHASVSSPSCVTVASGAVPNSSGVALQRLSQKA